jgi:CRP/FNR family transcriptional regulator, anaerobic regulatory protein
MEDGNRQATAASNDGDAYRFCRTCAFSAACRDGGYPKSRLRSLHVLVEHVGPFSEGEHIFREGERFRAIAAVRVGTVKTSITDASGREQVLGFFLPGEVIGLNAIWRARYPCNVVALDAVSLCRLSFEKMATLATHMPALQARLFELLSEDIGKAGLLGGDFTAEARMAAFLISLSRRYAARGFSASRFRLAMTRTDIANYLGLAAETISRLLRRFQDKGWLRIDHREVTIISSGPLEELAYDVLRT